MKRSILIAALGMLAACNSTTQTTSGQAYLARHPATAEASDPGNIENTLRKIANVEPTLVFPARIGLARIDGGRLSAVPGEEVAAWNGVHDRLSAAFGEFVPLSPMVAQMAEAGAALPDDDRMRYDTMNQIRIGAARQHVDAVLVYEAYSKTDEKSNLLSIADLTIIGGYLLPSKTTETEGYATAMLIDVMQGYPYGTVSTTVEKDTQITSRWGWGSDNEKDRADDAQSRAVVALSKEVETMLRKLRAELEAKRTNSVSQ